jgi:hypothetical protein
LRKILLLTLLLFLFTPVITTGGVIPVLPEPVEGADVRIKKVIEWGIDSQYMNDVKFTFESDWTSDFELGDGEYIDFKLAPREYEITEITGGWDLDRVTLLGLDSITESGPTVKFYVNVGDQLTITFYNRPPDFVIPETLLGTLGSLIVMMGILLLYNYRNGTLKVVVK